MNKQDLVAKIAKDVDLSKSTAAAAVDSIIDGITKALKKGDSVTFVGFGTFKTSVRKARTARNPQTGAAIKVPKRRVPRFSAGAEGDAAAPGPKPLLDELGLDAAAIDALRRDGVLAG